MERDVHSIKFETDLGRYPEGGRPDIVRMVVLPIPWGDFIKEDETSPNDERKAYSLHSNVRSKYGWTHILAYPDNSRSQTIIEAKGRQELALRNMAALTFDYPRIHGNPGRTTKFILDPLNLGPTSEDEQTYAHRGAIYTAGTVYYSAEAPTECVDSIREWDPETFEARLDAAEKIPWGFTDYDDDHQTNEHGGNQVQYHIDREFISRHGNVLIQGVAGCGKSHLLESLQREYEGNVEVVVFHPSTTYEDFVRGLRPSESSFEVRDGIFLELCKKAASQPDTDYLLFIDEINRANTARVLGDLMLVLEKSKRRTFKEGVPALEIARPVPAESESFASVKLQLAATQDDAAYGTQKGNQYLSVPSNLHVVGTMNTTDRSTGTIDLALQRRFKVVVQRPLTANALEDALLEAIAEKGEEAAYLTNGEESSALHEKVAALVEWWGKLNDNLEEMVGPDAMVGHSYFFSTIGDDYPGSTDGSSEIEDEDQLRRNAYLNNVAEMILNQLAEVALLFNISPDALADIQEIEWAFTDVPGFWVEHCGNGLGAMPQVVIWHADEESLKDSDGDSEET